MVTRLNSIARLTQLNAKAPAESEWWLKQSEQQQKDYLQEHPGSKREVTDHDDVDDDDVLDDADTTKKSSNEKSSKPHKIDVSSRNYAPNVEAKGKHGITMAARVGIAGDVVLPPPNIPRLPNLTKQEREVEEAFASDIEADPEGAATAFLAMVMANKRPPTFGTDDAKMLSASWAGEEGEERSKRRATLNVALHQTANGVAKKAFMQHLDSLTEGDEVFVTVGGCGAGKGYSLKNVDAAKSVADSAAAVWDSAGDQNATENPWIQAEAEKRGLKVTYAYVHADPEISWADPQRGVIKRANDPKDGRMVDSQVFADSYAIGAANHAAFANQHKDNPNAKFIYIDSSKGTPTQVDTMPEDALKVNREKLASFATDAVHKSDAPAHVKEGALCGERIWGETKPHKAEASMIGAKHRLIATDPKEPKYTWVQYNKDEGIRLDKFNAHKNAGKYGKPKATPVKKDVK